jgi:oxygen-independent coproporphyrinogen-3 oxidase
MAISGLYIHIPFCAKRCHYCDFNTYEGQEGLAGDYVEALIKDLHSSVQAGIQAVDGGLRSVYFGGGTPSILEASQVRSLLVAVEASLGLAPGAELTLEVNPGTADLEKFKALRAAGVNRLSFGFQAAQERHLQALGRIHSAQESEAAWALAREAGFDNLSLDLMFGLSGQTLEDWQESLAWALERRPEHISFYGLTIEPGTRFHQWHEQGKLPVPGEDLQADMYELGVNALAEAGLAQYEISNFARPGRASVHNQFYWLNRDTLGLGAGAWSFVDGRRYSRSKMPSAYIAEASQGRLGSPQDEALEGFDARAEAAFLNLRLNEGVDLADWRRRYGVDLIEEFGPRMATSLKAGCLEQVGGRLRLTDSGRLLANQVFSALL